MPFQSRMSCQKSFERSENQRATTPDSSPSRQLIELRMCRFVALLSVLTETRGFSIGQSEYDFILRNVLLVLAAKLTDDFSERFNTEWFEAEIVPDVIVPLTSRGEVLIKSLWSNLGTYLSPESYKHFDTATELATMISRAAQEESDLLDRSDRFGSEPR
jgi:hypothetical protein